MVSHGFLGADLSTATESEPQTVPVEQSTEDVKKDANQNCLHGRGHQPLRFTVDDNCESYSEENQTGDRNRRQDHQNDSYPLESYTVGWIASTENDLAAAISMLDEEHGEPDGFEQLVGDTNSYHWGRIGRHNLVITSLLQTRGKIIGASTAKELVMSHPHLRFGVSVGTGSGIPRPKHDVRLGDVVVSMPKGTSGGCVQYDFIKAGAGDIAVSGHLNSASDTLQKAAIHLSATNTARGLTSGGIPDIMEEVLQRRPWLAKSGSWTYPGVFNDTLYRETYYRNGHDPCDFLEKSSSTTPLERQVRQSNDPRIHFGIIGSGDTWVKNTNERERILRRLPYECLCLETKAAGIMNCFPCLVIRGIGNYGDLRQTQMWAGYASFTAAAYAKDLLENTPGETRTGVSRIRGDPCGNATSVTKLAELDYQQLQYLLTSLVSKTLLPARSLSLEDHDNLDRCHGDWDIYILRRHRGGKQDEGQTTKSSGTDIFSEKNPQSESPDSRHAEIDATRVPDEPVFQFGRAPLRVPIR